MLQVDQSQLEVYSCSFQLGLGLASIPLRARNVKYYVEWKMKSNGKLKQSQHHSPDTFGMVSFGQTLKLHTQILKHLGEGRFLRKFSQITVYLVSSKADSRPKIVGSMLVGLHEVLNANTFSQMKRRRVTISPLDVQLEFRCVNVECNQTSILQANLDSALIAEEKFLYTHGGTLSGIKLEKEVYFMKKRVTKEYLAEDQQISRGDCSMIRPDFEESIDLGDRQNNPREGQQLQMNHILVDLQQENRGGDFYLKENKTLKRLLMVLRNERRIEVDRLQEELRGLARELALKEAELLTTAESKDWGCVRVGQLLDEADCSREKCVSLRQQNQLLRQQLLIEKQLNVQLGQNYVRLQSRVQVVRDWEQQRRLLLQKMGQLQQQNELIKVKYFDIESKIYLQNQSHNVLVKKYGSQIQQLQSELSDKNHRITSITSKVAKFQQQLSLITAEEDIVHKCQYSAKTNGPKHKWSSPHPKTSHTHVQNNNSTSFITILDNEQQGLRRIKEEDLQESLASAEGDKELTTATSLPQHNQSEFYRNAAKKLQSELDQLRRLYHQRERWALGQRKISKDLKSQLQRLRFQFVYELSKVTSSLNQKIFEIKELKQENLRLKKKQFVSFQKQIFQLHSTVNHLEQQRLQFFDRCFRLEEENLALINLNHQKEDIYQSMLRIPPGEDNQERDIVIKQFQRVFKVMCDHKEHYLDTLKMHGFEEEEYSRSIVIKQPSTIRTHPISNISQIIQKFNQSQGGDRSDSDSNPQSGREQQELLLQSTAKGRAVSNQSSQVSCFLQKISGELNELSLQRQRSVGVLKDMASRSQMKKKQRIGPLLQLIKKTILKSCGQDHRMQLLRQFKGLETTLSSVDVY